MVVMREGAERFNCAGAGMVVESFYFIAGESDAYPMECHGETLKEVVSNCVDYWNDAEEDVVAVPFQVVEEFYDETEATITI